MYENQKRNEKTKNWDLFCWPASLLGGSFRDFGSG